MHQNSFTNQVWLRLSTEGGLRHRVTDLSEGDLPPKSPEFYEMLPSLRSSPTSLLQARQDDNSDSFHVVPSVSNKNTEPHSVTDTYETFLRNLEYSDNQDYGNDFLHSPEELHLTNQIVGEGACHDLCDDFQIYLQNGTSPTPVENLYSTLPTQEAARTFEFPNFDENQRLENMEVSETGQKEVSYNKKSQSSTTNDDLSEHSEFPYDSLKIRQQQSSRKRKVSETSGEKSRNKKTDIERTISRTSRPSHNDIERQRRNDMKARFDALKGAIPEIERMDRAPKIQILSKATDYIMKLHAEEKTLDNEKQKERKRNRLLLDKLVKLTQVA